MAVKDRKLVALCIFRENGASFLEITLDSGTAGSPSNQDNDRIRAKKGACFITLPKEIIVKKENIEVKWYDIEKNKLKGASLPYFREIVMGIIKLYTPHPVSKYSKKAAKLLDVGALEEFTPHSIFYDKAYKPYFIKWEEELEDFATKEIWYYEHQLPEGSKGYSMTKPIRLEEFDKEKEWWKNREDLSADKAGSEVSWIINLSEVIEKAAQNAKPHYEKEKELKREAYSLKEKLTQLKRVKTPLMASPQTKNKKLPLSKSNYRKQKPVHAPPNKRLTVFITGHLIWIIKTRIRLKKIWAIL